MSNAWDRILTFFTLQRTVTSCVYTRRAVQGIADQLVNDGPIPPKGCGNDDGNSVPLWPLIN